jgi:FkbM family methyltransferase
MRYRAIGRRALGATLKLLPGDFRLRLGVHLGRPDLRFSFLKLRQFSFFPKCALDGGSFRGEWSRTCLEIWPDAFVLCVEPQQDMQAHLKKFEVEKAPQVKVLQCLLGPEDRNAVPFKDSGSGSSIFGSEDSSHLCPMWSVDSLIEQGFGPFDFVKLDVQGYELQILQGFERHFDHCTLLQLELNLLPIVHGAPLVADVIAFLDQRGFVLFDIEELIRAPSDGAVWQIDALFCRKDSPLRLSRQWS